MGYRIFYSYQSDIKKKLNQTFIRDAINAAILKITDFDIEPLLEGFYGVGGNPPLAETMLDQSKGSSIVFIGDVTFTSSKIWQSQGVNFYEDSKSYLIEINKPLDLKPAPNPNVLLETGYSWALKCFNRTILVMNMAFGDPKDLPVDMKGLRRPITYNLSEDRSSKKTKFDKEFIELSNALEFAIRDAIKSSIDHHKMELAPIITFQAWKKEHPFPYCKGQYGNSLITSIKTLITSSKNYLRIIGPNGIGKTRLVLEALENIDKSSNLKNITIYYDLKYPFQDGTLMTKLSLLKEKEQLLFLLIDNCPIEQHYALEKYLRNSMIKLLTLGSIEDEENEIYNLKIENKLIEENFRNIINFYFPAADYETIRESFRSNLDLFVQSISAGADSNEIVKPLKELLPIIVGEDNMKRGAIPLLTSIELFKMIAVTGRKKSQIQFINSFFIKGEIENTEILIEDLISKNLLRKQGDFILDSGLEDTLINDWINSEGAIDISLLIKKVSENNMWASFKDNFFKLLEQKDYLMQIQGDTGILQDDVFINSQVGKDFLNILADKHPKIVLEVLKIKIKG